MFDEGSNGSRVRRLTGAATSVPQAPPPPDFHPLNAAGGPA